MNDKIMNRKSIFKAEYFICFILLLTSVDTVFFGTTNNSFFVLIPRIVALISCVSLLFIKRNICIDKSFYALTLLGLIITASFFINNGDVYTFISKILFLVTGGIIAMCVPKEIFIASYDCFLKFVCFFALFFEILAYVAPGVFNYFPIITNASGTQFYSIFFVSLLRDTIRSVAIRMSGIFWEPGAFAVYLIIGLILQLFYHRKSSIKTVILYIICIIFTFSTTGIVALSFLIFVYVLFPNKLNKNVKVLIILSSFLAVSFLILGRETSLYQIFFGKIINGTSTALTRWASFIVPFYIGHNNFWIGVFPNNVGDAMREYANFVPSSLTIQASNMCTNTLTYQIAAFGFVFALVYITGIYCFCIKNQKMNIILGTLIFVVLALAFFGENLYSFFPYVLIFYGYKKKEVNKNENC